MPLRQVPGTDLHYHLVSFDKDGRERAEADGTMRSETVRALVADRDAPVTDVFFLSHGWKGDVPAAIDQYDRWIGEMARSAADREEARRRRPGFRPLLVGLHWPSQPWGDERLAADAGGGLLSTTGDGGAVTATVDELVEAYAGRLADTPAARQALRTILEAAQRDDEPAELPPEVRAAYATLRAEAELVDDGEIGTGPGAAPEPWDAEAVYQEARGDAGGVPGLLGGDGGDRFDKLLSPLRQLSFWKMKDRARRFGEHGAGELLRRLQDAAPPATRFHLMGHSFGCIVVSATVAGRPDGAPLARPVDSLFLVQGALSLWAYSADIPHARGTPGYFHRIVKDGMVRGPIVTTRSEHDTAVAKFYPMGVKVARQYVLGDDFPKYGGIGAFGAQGLGAVAEDVAIQPATYDYGFQPGRIYNIEASRVIAKREGASGAHSDIAHPEVAHAAWQAALTGI